MERSWSGFFFWSQVDSSSFKLESALRGRSQPGVSFRNWSQPGVNLRKLESTWSRAQNLESALKTWSELAPTGASSLQVGAKSERVERAKKVLVTWALMYILEWRAIFVGRAADEPPKRGSISRNRRDETRLRGCWFRGAA